MAGSVMIIILIIQHLSLAGRGGTGQKENAD